MTEDEKVQEPASPSYSPTSPSHSPNSPSYNNLHAPTFAGGTVTEDEKVKEPATVTLHIIKKNNKNEIRTCMAFLRIKNGMIL